jgi:hypothetical protein
MLMKTEFSDRIVVEGVSTVAQKMRNLFDTRVRSQGLTVSRARALLRIADGHAINQRELAAYLAIETATLYGSSILSRVKALLNVGTLRATVAPSRSC